MRFVLGNDPSNVVELGNMAAGIDREGHFVIEIELPKRPSEEMQFIRATIRQNVGIPRFTETARITWEKIIETVFLALLATALGTLLAIPLSFLAARNLMKSVRSPLTSIAFSILGWPIGQPDRTTLCLHGRKKPLHHGQCGGCPHDYMVPVSLGHAPGGD